MRLVIDSVNPEAVDAYRWPHKIGYVNGRISAWPATAIADAAARGELLALIDVLGTSPHAASIIDWERGDLQNPDALRDWVIARNKFRGDAVVYCNRSSLTTVINALQSEHFYLWLADPTDNHEAPMTPPPLGLPPSCTLLGIQYALSPDSGGQYDISVFYVDDWHMVGRHEDTTCAAMGTAEPRTGVGLAALDARQAVAELVGQAEAELELESEHAAAAAGLEAAAPFTDGPDPDPGPSPLAVGSAASGASTPSAPRPVPAAALSRSQHGALAPGSAIATSSASPASFRVPPGLLQRDAGPASEIPSSSSPTSSPTSTSSSSTSSGSEASTTPPASTSTSAAAATSAAAPAPAEAPSPTLPHAWLQAVLSQVREAATVFRGAGAGHAAQLLEQAASVAAEVGSILQRAGL